MNSTRVQAPPEERAPATPALFSVGFRPFFLMAAIWAAIAVPVWLTVYVHGYAPRGTLPAVPWHAHEMVFGFGMAVLAGFLLTAIPNWTGRLPIRGAPLAVLAAMWLAGRIALLSSELIGAAAAAAIDLLFPLALMAAVARELIAGRNWRNLPMLVALGFLIVANASMHLQAPIGQRLGIATLLALIALVGGRIVPAFTRNWLVKNRPQVKAPAATDRFDLLCLALTVLGLAAWVANPDASILPAMGGIAAAARLSRWRGLATLREPLVFVLHASYAWLALGLVYVGLNGTSAALHALTVGAIGTMTLGVMTRATLGHTGRALAADVGTVAIYLLVTLAAALRVSASMSGESYVLLTSLSGVAWSAAFAIFVLHYGPMLIRSTGRLS